MNGNYHLGYQKIRLDELYLAQFTELYLHSNCQRYLKGKDKNFLTDHSGYQKIRLDELYLAQFTELYLHSNCQRYLKGKL